MVRRRDQDCRVYVDVEGRPAAALSWLAGGMTRGPGRGIAQAARVVLEAFAADEVGSLAVAPDELPEVFRFTVDTTVSDRCGEWLERERVARSVEAGWEVPRSAVAKKVFAEWAGSPSPKQAESPQGVGMEGSSR